MKKIAFSGTLDPITNGHMWVIQEARELADEVIVFISENPSKKPLFSAELRKEIVLQSAKAKGWNNVGVVTVQMDYTARAVKRSGIDYLIRGIRNTADFDYENLIQQANVELVGGAKTIFVMPPRDLGSVSSSFLRGLQGPIGWHWSIKKFLPEPAYRTWIYEWLRKEWDSLWQLSSKDEFVQKDSRYWFEYLIGENSYGSQNRHYHNLDHLVHGLTEINVWAANTSPDNSDVELAKKAFWFHDAVYKQGAQVPSNEEQSASLWLSSQLDPSGSSGPAELIRATDHLQMTSIVHPLRDVILSIDLSILGQPEDVYEEYAKAIRREYIVIDQLTYRTNRKLVLNHFLQKALKGELFLEPYFSSLYNQRAIENIERELKIL
jgi:pantetheine-phosphate adenylyltransferase